MLSTGAHFLPPSNLSAPGYLAAAEGLRRPDFNYQRYLQQITNNQPNIDRLALRPVIDYLALAIDNQDYRARQAEITSTLIAIAPYLLQTQSANYPDHFQPLLQANAQVSLPLILDGVAELGDLCQQYFRLPPPKIKYPRDLSHSAAVIQAQQEIADYRHNNLHSEYRRSGEATIGPKRRRQEKIVALIYSSGWGALINESLPNVVDYAYSSERPAPFALQLITYWLTEQLSARQISPEEIETATERFWPQLHRALVQRLLLISGALAQSRTSIEERLAAN
jgi:hypothetical protein